MGNKDFPDGLIRLWESLDSNGNGVVTRAELYRELATYGFPSDKIRKFFNDMDRNMDEQITLKEYKHALGFADDDDDQENAKWRQFYCQLDTDRSGQITSNELISLFEDMHVPLSRSIIDSWIADHDVNGDGTLNYNEFVKFVEENALGY